MRILHVVIVSMKCKAICIVWGFCCAVAQVPVLGNNQLLFGHNSVQRIPVYISLQAVNLNVKQNCCTD